MYNSTRKISYAYDEIMEIVDNTLEQVRKEVMDD